MNHTREPARDRAVVIGASMAGLLAARVLSDHYEEVVVVDRDRLPTAVEPRRGVPQGQHLHSLLGRGDEIMRELFPGILAELEAAGAERTAIGRQLRFITPFGELPRVDVTEPALCATRPLIEDGVRRRVLAHPAVRLRDATDASGLVTDADGRVTGLRIFPHDEGAESVLPADLVVDAGGRAGRTVTWLESLGHGRPPEDKVQSNMAYASRRYRLTGAPGGDHFIVVTARPDRPLGMAAGIVEGDSWLVTLFGYGRSQPSTAEADFLPQLEAVAPPDLVAAVRGGTPLGPVHGHRTPTSVRRNYQRMRTFPRGLLVFGDALCAFNPIYGQGMTVAAQQAVALGDWLAGGSDDPRAFFRLAAPVVAGAWDIVNGADLSIPEVPGPRPLPVRLIGRYMTRLQAVAVVDPVVAHAYLRVLNLLDRPATLMRPAIARRVMGPRRAASTAPTSSTEAQAVSSSSW